MKLRTASQTISFVKELEEKSAKFYNDLSQIYSKDAEVLLSFALENKKYVTQIQRTYYSVITDAIEGGYAFDLNPDEYTFEIELPKTGSYSDSLAKAVEIEEKMLKFYSVAAEQSMSLMADVPRNFKILAKKRKDRIQQLKSLS